MTLIETYNLHKKKISGLLFVIGFLFILYLVKKSWLDISNLILQLNKIDFTIAIIIGVLNNVVLAILFNRLLRKHAVNISERLTLKIYMAGQIAKYVPGKIWGIAYQISHFEGLPNATGVVLANFELMLGAMYMTCIVAITIICFFVNKFLAVIVALSGLIAFTSLYKSNIASNFIRKLLTKFNVKIGLAEIEHMPNNYFAGAIFYILFCSAYVFSFVYMLNAAFEFSFEESLVYIALLSLAWIGGVLVFVVPHGMGVRELIFVVTSGYIIQAPSMEVLLSIAILSRLTQIIQELVGLIFVVFLRKEKLLPDS